MRKPHELPDSTTRRGALGLIAGFGGLAIGAAPHYHAKATLDADLAVLGYEYVDADAAPTYGTRTGDDPPRYWPIDELRAEVTNRSETPLDPLFTNWDQRRRTRHNWPIEAGATPLPPGETDTYRIVAPGESGALHGGLPAQLTVWRRGEEVWKSVQFTPENHPEADP